MLSALFLGDRPVPLRVGTQERLDTLKIRTWCFLFQDCCTTKYDSSRCGFQTPGLRKYDPVGCVRCLMQSSLLERNRKRSSGSEMNDHPFFTNESRFIHRHFGSPPGPFLSLDAFSTFETSRGLFSRSWSLF